MRPTILTAWLLLTVVHSDPLPSEDTTTSPEEGKSLQIDQLSQMYQVTQNSFIQLNTERALVYQQLYILRDSVKATKSETSVTVSCLVSDVRNDVGQLISEIQSLKNEMRAQVYSVNTLNTTTMDQLNDLQSSVNTLTKVTSPVDIYRGCVQMTSNCTVTLAGPYWAQCYTHTNEHSLFFSITGHSVLHCRYQPVSVRNKPILYWGSNSLRVWLGSTTSASVLLQQSVLIAPPCSHHTTLPPVLWLSPGVPALWTYWTEDSSHTSSIHHTLYPAIYAKYNFELALLLSQLYIIRIHTLGNCC